MFRSTWVVTSQVCSQSCREFGVTVTEALSGEQAVRTQADPESMGGWRQAQILKGLCRKLTGHRRSDKVLEFSWEHSDMVQGETESEKKKWE